MKKYWQVLGVAAIIIGIVYYPVLKVYQYITKQKGEGRQEEEETIEWKIFAPSYRGKQNSHRSHTQNGDANMA